MYKKITKREGMRVRTFFKEEVQEVSGKNGKIRSDIAEKVADRDTLIADLFKLNFLTISALSEMYKVIDKTDIPDDVKSLLDESFRKYNETETIMDLYLSNGDTSFIDRMLKRQDDITILVKESWCL